MMINQRAKWYSFLVKYSFGHWVIIIRSNILWKFKFSFIFRKGLKFGLNCCLIKKVYFGLGLLLINRELGQRILFNFLIKQWNKTNSRKILKKNIYMYACNYTIYIFLKLYIFYIYLKREANFLRPVDLNMCSDHFRVLYFC